jgi:membrane-anchored glycerophosphoryl diester phosphodiesterase (GDPDase)
MIPLILNIETEHIASVWVKIAQQMGVGKWNLITVISVAVLLLLLFLLLLLLCLLLKFSYVIFGVGNNVNKEALCWLQIKDNVMCV